MQISPIRASVVMALALSVGLISACSPPKTPEEQVKERIEARYASVIKNDTKAVYEFLTPEKRASQSYENYLGTHPQRIIVSSAKVLKVECPTADACNAETQLEYEFAKNFKGSVPGMVNPVVPEKWVRVDGQWYFYPRR